MTEGKRLIRDFPSIQKIFDLQEVLYNLNSDNLSFSVHLIQSISISIDSLARNLYRFSAIRSSSEQLFVDLVLNLKDKIEIEKSLFNNFKFVIFFRCENFAEALRNNGINLPEVGNKEQQSMNSANRGKITRDTKIYELIKNDNIDNLSEIVTEIGFDINKGISCSLFPKFLFFEETATLICLAACCRAVKCFKYLMINGANLKMGNLTKFAIAGGNCEIIRLLEQKGLIYDYNSIPVAIKMHNVEIFDWLMEKYPGRLEIRSSIENEFIYGIQDIPVEDFTINNITQAQSVGFSELVEVILLHAQFKPEFLNIAIYFGYEEISLTFLQNPNVDINWLSLESKNKNNFLRSTPLYLACEKGMIRIVQELISNKSIKVNKGSLNPIYIAAIKNHVEIVKLLITHKDTKVQLGSEQLVKILETWNEELIQILIFDRDVESYNCSQLVECAIKNNRLDYLKKFLEKPRIDVAKALLKAKDEVLDILLDYPDVDINKADDSKGTPLMHAINENNRKFIIKLLSHPKINVSFNSVTTSYYNRRSSLDLNHGIKVFPLVWAIEQKDDEIIDLILKNPTLKINEVVDGMSPFIKACMTDIKYVEKIINHLDFSPEEIKSHFEDYQEYISEEILSIFNERFPDNALQ